MVQRGKTESMSRRNLQACEQFCAVGDTNKVTLVPWRLWIGSRRKYLQKVLRGQGTDNGVLDQGGSSEGRCGEAIRFCGWKRDGL